MKTRADYPKLNLPPCRLRVEQRGVELYVWDTMRRRQLLLTPEEWVRRHVLAMLTGPKDAGGAGIAATAIAQEHPAEVNGVMRRADIVVFGPEGKPLLVVECKAPGVAIDAAVLDQAHRYNAVLGARYVMLTNGLDHYLYELTAEGDYAALREWTIDF